MAYAMRNQPIYILSSSTRRTHGRDARSMNIAAAKAVSGAVRTTLGPRGVDKMLVDSLGEVVITNDGATILKEMDVTHPTAQMIIEVAETQDEEAGDGTTTAAILAGELLARAEDLLEDGVHPTVVAGGYRRASEYAHEVLADLAVAVERDDIETLRELASTAMTGKSVEDAREQLADIVVGAVTAVADERDGGVVVDLDDIDVEPVPGGSVGDSTLVEGVVVDKERAHDTMPERVEDARIALVSVAIEPAEPGIDAEIALTTPEQYQAFLDRQDADLLALVDDITDSGATVVFCQKGIDDLVQHFLARRGVLAVRRVKKSDMKRLARATGGRLITDLDDIDPADLGHAGLVEEREVGADRMLFVEECDEPRSVSVIVRGGTEHVVEEIERALEDAIRVVRVALLDGEVVAGGAATEVELAMRLREYADGVSGREQLAVLAYADALDIVPRTLAENAGLDPIDTLVALRAAHANGETAAGLDVETGDPVDMLAARVVEPLRVKRQAIESAGEVAELILRIDDVIAATRLERDEEFDEF